MEVRTSDLTNGSSRRHSDSSSKPPLIAALVAIATVVVVALATPFRSCLADESDTHGFVIADGEAA